MAASSRGGQAQTSRRHLATAFSGRRLDAALRVPCCSLKEQTVMCST